MNFEDKIRAEYEAAVEEDCDGCSGKHTITELAGFVESHLNSAKEADADNDPGATQEALARAGGMALYALRSHGQKWHYGEPASEREAAQKRARLAEEKVERCKVSMSDLQGQIFERDERIKELEEKLAYEKKQEQGYQGAIGELMCKASERDEQIEKLAKERDDFSTKYDNAHYEIDRLMGIEAEHEDEIYRLEKEIEEQKAEQQRLLAKITCLRNTNGHDLERAVDLLRMLVDPEAQRAAIPLSALAQNAIDRIKRLEGRPVATIDQRIEQLADLELELANAYATRATDDFAEVEARCWDLEKAEGHYRRREQLLKEWGEEEDR